MKLYNKLAKEWIHEIITDYTSNISLTLSMLSQSDEGQQQQPKPHPETPEADNFSIDFIE